MIFIFRCAVLYHSGVTGLRAHVYGGSLMCIANSSYHSACQLVKHIHYIYTSLSTKKAGGHVSGVSLHENLSLAEDITSDHRTEAKVRLTTKSSKDIANIVGSVDTLCEGAVPALENTLDDLDTGEVAEPPRKGRSKGCAQQGFEGRIVFLGGGAVVASAVGDQGDVGGSNIAFDYTRAAGGGTSGVDLVVGVQSTVGDSSVRVVEGCLAGEVCSDLLQVLVDLEDLGTVDVLRVLGRAGGTKRDVSSAVVGRDIAGIELVLKSDLDGVASEGDGTDGSDLGVDSSNTGNHEVRGGQVETRATDQRGDGDCSINLRLSSDDLTDISILGTVNIREQRRGTRKGDRQACERRTQKRLSSNPRGPRQCWTRNASSSNQKGRAWRKRGKQDLRMRDFLHGCRSSRL
ncbi:purine nucleoside permease, partial [Aureobasidium melanogenum]